jgi:hypothetical protein
MYTGVKDRGDCDKSVAPVDVWSAAIAAEPLTNEVNATPKIHFLTVI